MTTLAPLFLIGSSLFLQVTWTTIKSRMGSKFKLTVTSLYISQKGRNLENTYFVNNYIKVIHKTFTLW